MPRPSSRPERERLLADRSVDHAFLHQVQGGFVHVHGYQFTIRGMRALQRLCDILAGRGFQADERVDLVLACLGEHRLCVVEGVARVAFDVYDLRHADTRATGEHVCVPLQALIQVRLTGHGVEDHIPLPMQFLYHALPTKASCL